MKYPIVLLIVFFLAFSLSAQTSSRKSIKLEGAKSSSVEYAVIKNDKILITGYNYFIPDFHYYTCLLDTNLNVIHYINHLEIDEDVQGGEVDLFFTNDGGYLIPKQTVADSVAYDLFKYNTNNELEWFKPIYGENFKSVVKIIETDTSFFIFGNTVDYINNGEDLVYQVYVDEISNSGDYLSTRILFEKEAFLNFWDAIIVDTTFVVSYSYATSFSSTPKFDRTCDFIIYDRNFNKLNKWQGKGSGSTINYVDDEYYFSTRHISDPDFLVNLPRHLVRKLSSDLELVWTNDYLYPPFSYDEGLIGINNIIRQMWPDPRGGLYIVGDLFGPESNFEDPLPMGNPYGPDRKGTSLIKINEAGDEIWHYKDRFDKIIPRAAATLSSGNIIIIGEGSVLDEEDGNFRRTVTAIKLDKDGCHEPGCRDDVNVHDIEDYRIEISPNPSKGMLVISCNSSMIKELNVLDVNGSIIHTINNPTSHIEVEILDSPSGVYFARFITSNNEVITKKIVKR